MALLRPSVRIRYAPISSKFMSKLNLEQERAVNHVEGPLLVLAGAGSGKTRVVTHRIAHLIEIGISPEQILAVTFTNKAAEEMKARIRSLKNVYVLASTFHSLGAKILRESIHHLGYKNSFSIYDEDDSLKLLKTCLEELQYPLEKAFVKETREKISSSKNDLIEPHQIKNNLQLQTIYSLYQKKLKSCDALDFDDLLFLTVILFKEHPTILTEYQNRWRFVLIDEYQDTNLSQYTITKMLVEKHQNIFAVGDPDQSIYSWRGAKYQNILNFGNDFQNATIITLNQNYRSTNTILKAANALISHNHKRYQKQLWSALGDGNKIGICLALNEKKEAEFMISRILQHREEMSLDHMAIFYRTNAQSRTFEDALLFRRINYTIIGGISFYERQEIKDILAYLKMVLSNSDLISFLRTINTPKRGLGATTIDKIVKKASEEETPILIFCEKLLEDPSILKLSPKQKEALRSYLQLIHSLRNMQNQCTLSELIRETILRCNYLEYLAEDQETAQDRKENIDELVSKAAEWEEEKEDPSLPIFLEELSLRVPTAETENTPKIRLMTLHNSKGLEFDIVFLVGLEEDLLPHINSKDDPEKLEEERRLCYVGMTRAKEQLYISLARYRYTWGVERYMKPSPFFFEIPSEYTKILRKDF